MSDETYDGKVTWMMINDIMDTFQFEKVHRAMVALDWSWASVDGVPELHEVKKCARVLLTECAFSDTGYLATGGFRAERDEQGNLSLLFYIDCWEANGTELIAENKHP